VTAHQPVGAAEGPEPVPDPPRHRTEGRVRLRRHAARRQVPQRTARQAGLGPKADRLSSHSLLHAAITAALDA